MREIKLRAWDGEKMSYTFNMGDIAYEGLPEMCYTNEERDELKDDIIFMQYIGIEDKNGKEIYEGDLVRCIAEEKYLEESGVYPIEYDLFEQQFRPNFACHLGWGGWDSIEVIGNIYDNPEIVTVTKILKHLIPK